MTINITLSNGTVIQKEFKPPIKQVPYYGLCFYTSLFIKLMKGELESDRFFKYPAAINASSMGFGTRLILK